MVRATVTLDSQLRHLLRAGRRAPRRMSQREAAARAGISTVYWQKIESGRIPSAPTDTLAAMLAAVDVPVEVVRELDYHHIAEQMDTAADVSSRSRLGPEDHLAITPTADAHDVALLQQLWRWLKANRLPDSFEEELRRPRRDPQDKAHS